MGFIVSVYFVACEADNGDGKAGKSTQTKSSSQEQVHVHIYTHILQNLS